MVPYVILRCSWPRPAIESPDGPLMPEPDWDSPPTHLRPEPEWRNLPGESCWTIDWRELFRGGKRFGGEMRGFHLVFEIRVTAGGRLHFYSSYGCTIRRDGEVIFRDPALHSAVSGQIDVEAGDRLEIAQWQCGGDWIWAGRIENHEVSLARWLPAVEQRLSRPGGPPLKMYCHGGSPLRTVVALYSMILNGYSPTGVHLYGDYQWPNAVRRIFASLLPFAQVGALEEVTAQIREVGSQELADIARQYWFVMKCCVSLLCGPSEFCLMDDDIFVLDAVHDALSAFRDCDFVFAPDADNEPFYRMVWQGVFEHASLRATAALNTGLYWLRPRHDRPTIAELLLRGSGALSAEWAWEQGFFANLYADARVHRLPAQRYFYPLFDGLPGGITGYDYALNPCGFASIHFGGPVEKPDDAVTEMLAPQILRPRVATARRASV